MNLHNYIKQYLLNENITFVNSHKIYYAFYTIFKYIHIYIHNHYHSSFRTLELIFNNVIQFHYLHLLFLCIFLTYSAPCGGHIFKSSFIWLVVFFLSRLFLLFSLFFFFFRLARPPHSFTTKLKWRILKLNLHQEHL